MAKRTTHQDHRRNVRFQPSSPEGEPASDIPMAFDVERPGSSIEGNRSRSDRAAARRPRQGQRRNRQHLEPTIGINKDGETVMRTFGTTKRSRENPVRLSDGKVHPVTVRRIGDDDAG